MKKCRNCGLEKDESLFYYLGYIKKRSGNPAYSSYCRECNNSKFYKRKGNKPYKPSLGKRDKQVVANDNIDIKSIYLLLKRIEINNLKLSYIDGLRLVNLYIEVYGNDIAEYYSEGDQLDIMYFKLCGYVKQKDTY